MANIITDNITETKSGVAFNGTVTSQLSTTVQRVLIGSIPISSYFGGNIQTFYDTYKNKNSVKFDFAVDVNVMNQNFTILLTEKRYRSDGLLDSQRRAQFTDIIDVYAILEVPVKYETSISSTPQAFFHLDLNPTPGHKHTVARKGFAEWIPPDNSKEPLSLSEVDNRDLLAKQVNVYMRPTSIRTVSYGAAGSVIAGTLRYKVLAHTDDEAMFNPKDYRYDPTMLRLGKVMLQANSTIEDNMTILDTRTRGGGLDEAISRDIIKQVNEESLYNWDIGYFDGEAYQENGVFIIKLPRSVLKSDKNPTGFEEAEIQAVVAKHKGFGVLPIIEYYDEEVKDNNIIPNPEFLKQAHIGYYDEAKSSGTYDLKYVNVGSGDNYILQITDTGEYAVTLPGHLFSNLPYELNIKTKLETGASARSVGVVDITYTDGSTLRTQLPKMSSTSWGIVKQTFDMDKNIHHVTITLNKTTEVRNGLITFDYMKLTPNPNISAVTEEIHEI